MNPASPWLPDACLKGTRPVRQIRDAIADWSRYWIVGDPWLLIGSWQPGPVPAVDWQVLRDGRHASLQGGPGVVLRLALAMLGERDRTDLSRRDLKFLRRLAGAALDDLNGRLDGLHPRSATAPESAARENWSVSAGPRAEPLLRVTVAREQLCLLARGAYPPGKPRGLLASRDSVAADVRVPVAAHLGSTALPVAQLDTLEPGDVIVLDRPVSAPATLMVAERDTALACTITRDGASISLQLADQN